MEVLDSGWLTTGAKAREFEERFAALVGAEHAVALNSCTAALHLALEALGVGPRDEVLVPTWTFAATAEVVAYQRARPILLDVEPDSLNITPEIVRAAVTPRTRAVIPVHFAGDPADVAGLREVLDPLDIPVIEDAAHAFPCEPRPANGRLVGALGRAGAYSFYATKTITTGEGGMLVTDDGTLADRARVMSLHGISKHAWNRYTASGSWWYEIEAAGFKYNLTDLAAALGLAQLARAHELLDARTRLAGTYRQLLERSAVADLVELPAPARHGTHAWHLFVLRLNLSRLGIDRAAVIEALGARGIGASVHFIPLHMHPYHRRRQDVRRARLPNATAEFPRVISLPIWPGMSATDVASVVTALEEILTPGRR